MCGTCKDPLMGYAFLRLFLRTVSNISARIPLPSRLTACHLPPGGRFLLRKIKTAVDEPRRFCA